MTPLRPSLEEFSRLTASGEHNLVPVYTEMAADYETPVSAYQKLTSGGDEPDGVSFLLESAESSDQIGRFSFIGVSPRVVIRSEGREVTITEQGESTTRILPEIGADPLRIVETIMARYHPVTLEELPVFTGGAVGFLGYDMVSFFEPTVPQTKPDPLELPEMVFVVTDTLIIFDHRYRRLQVVANVFTDEHQTTEEAYESARTKVDAVLAKLSQPGPTALMSLMTEPEPLEIRSNTTQAEYEAMVLAAKEYILAGDAFQVVPSQRFEADYTGSPLNLYRALRHVNPSPYMFCLEIGTEFALVGSSPEVHVRAINGKIEIRPIAGTRHRGKTPEEDNALADELLNDPKERAEHVMLIDLARNDVGRVAKYHSVELTDMMIIERYSHVMHIVSNVIGQYDPADHSAYDVMRATFPAGTVSGSPKVRAMQIIDELEKEKRGAYSGAVGYFGFDGNHDSCIALRTVVLKDGKAYVQAGAGVVADSDPTFEYEETGNKARAMLKAIAHAHTLESQTRVPSDSKNSPAV